MASRGLLWAVVAESSMVSSSRKTVAEPAAWRASRPDSKRTTCLPCAPLSMIASVN